MKPVQIMLNEDLLGRLDRVARKRHLSRSAFIRRSLEAALEAEQTRELIEAERRGYAAHPVAVEEERGYRSLAKAQEAVLARLSKEDPW